MDRNVADVYRCPVEHTALRLDTAETRARDIVRGELVSPEGRRYVIRDGIPDFVIAESLTPAEARIRAEYDLASAGTYDAAVDWVFAVFHEDEDRIREAAVDLLALEPGFQVLEVGCGSGRHTSRIARRLGAAGTLFATDLSLLMAARCRSKMRDPGSAAAHACKMYYATANALSLPFAENHFDIVFHAGGFNQFADHERAVAEFSRVVKPGGLVMFGDESIAPWLRGTEFQRILSTSNSLYNSDLPLAALPEHARDVTTRFMLGNCYYVITFRKGVGLPPLDLDLPHKDGQGTLRSRYFGSLEVLSPARVTRPVGAPPGRVESRRRQSAGLVVTSGRASPYWRREGLLVTVKPGHPWWRSHAQSPTVLPISNRLWRIYFAARDGANQSQIVAVDVDPADRMRVIAEHLEPLLDRGPPGTFDHAGIGPSVALIVNGQVRLYYTGIVVRADVRGQPSIGLAVSDDSLNFRKQFSGPILSTGPFDPYFASMPTMLHTSSGYRMWYAGGTEWRRANGTLDPAYEIRTRHSPDGLIWNTPSETAVAQRPAWVAGLGRPWITDQEGGSLLWFSRRGERYRSPDGDTYRLMSVRVDERGAALGTAEPVMFENPPASGDFDSWMQAYACVVPRDGELIMFYNGNDFGKAGFGWARLPADTQHR